MVVVNDGGSEGDTTSSQMTVPGTGTRTTSEPVVVVVVEIITHGHQAKGTTTISTRKTTRQVSAEYPVPMSPFQGSISLYLPLPCSLQEKTKNKHNVSLNGLLCQDRSEGHSVFQVYTGYNACENMQ